jgi:hypothetical protein
MAFSCVMLKINNTPRRLDGRAGFGQRPHTDSLEDQAGRG